MVMREGRKKGDTRLNEHFPETNGIGEWCLRDEATNKARIKVAQSQCHENRDKAQVFKSELKESLIQRHTSSLPSRQEYDRKHGTGAPTHTYSCTHTCLLLLFV